MRKTMVVGRVAGKAGKGMVPANYETTSKQIREMRKKRLAVWTPDNRWLSWRDLYKRGDVFTPLGEILVDRAMRFQIGLPMADVAPYCTFDVDDGVIEGVGLYAGKCSMEVMSSFGLPGPIYKISSLHSYHEDGCIDDQDGEETVTDYFFRRHSLSNKCVQFCTELLEFAHLCAMFPCQTPTDHVKVYVHILDDIACWFNSGKSRAEIMHLAVQRFNETRAEYRKSVMQYYAGFDLPL